MCDLVDDVGFFSASIIRVLKNGASVTDLTTFSWKVLKLLILDTSMTVVVLALIASVVTSVAHLEVFFLSRFILRMSFP